MSRPIKPIRRAPSLMDRTRAAVCYCNATDSEADKMAGFLALFHPDLKESSKRELIRDARERGRRR